MLINKRLFFKIFIMLLFFVIGKSNFENLKNYDDKYQSKWDAQITEYGYSATIEKYKSLKNRVFQATILQDEKPIKSCSTTLVKFANSCRLVTNAHCFDYKYLGGNIPITTNTVEISNFNQFDLLNYPTQYFFEYQSRVINKIKLKVVDIWPDADLAELTPLSTDLDLNNFCKQLPPVISQSDVEKPVVHIEEHFNIINIGFPVLTGGQVKFGYFGSEFDNKDFSQLVPLQKPKLKIKISKETTGLTGLKYIYKIQNVGLDYGMSGGLAIDPTDLTPIGITTRFIPFQDIGYVIPMSEVKRILLDKNNFAREKYPNLEKSEILAPRFDGQSFDIGGDNNSNDGGGDNNSNDGGGETKKPLIKNTLGLSYFMAPYEGVSLEKLYKKPIYALGFNNEQIDGYDDLHKKYILSAEYQRCEKELTQVQSESCHKNLLNKIISREIGQYPNISIRQGILSRMSGEFKLHDLSHSNDFVNLVHVLPPKNHIIESAKNIGFETNHLEQLKNAKLNFEHMQLNPYDQRNSQSYFNISVSEKQINIENKHKKNFVSQETHWSNVKLVPEFEQDYKILKLNAVILNDEIEEKQDTLICYNYNFLKLNCVGERMAITLSIVDRKQKLLEFRFVYRDEFNKIDEMLSPHFKAKEHKYIYYFGQIREI